MEIKDHWQYRLYGRICLWLFSEIDMLTK